MTPLLHIQKIYLLSFYLFLPAKVGIDHGEWKDEIPEAVKILPEADYFDYKQANKFGDKRAIEEQDKLEKSKHGH